jgi:hypothetical protein
MTWPANCGRPFEASFRSAFIGLDAGPVLLFERIRFPKRFSVFGVSVSFHRYEGEETAREFVPP